MNTRGMKPLAGTGALVRVILRRDRLPLLLWVGLLALYAIGQASIALRLYPNVELLREFAGELTHNPLTFAFYGAVYTPASADYAHILSALIVWRTAGGIVLLGGLANLLTVIRHTRTEEDAGRSELLRSAVLGRHAALTAALTITFAANVLLGSLIAIGFSSLGLPVMGSILIGLTLIVSLTVFAALARSRPRSEKTPGEPEGSPSSSSAWTGCF